MKKSPRHYFYKLNREEFKKAFEGCCDYFFDEAINFIYSQKEFECENKMVRENRRFLYDFY